MAKQRKAVDARTSNAGDDFHLLWAVRRALELLKPGTNLLAVKPEGITPEDAIAVDASGQRLLGVDLTEYYGGPNFKLASQVVYSQLKYSTNNPSASWTIAEVTRGKRANTFSGSLIRRLADVFKGHVDEFGVEQVLKATSLRLVSNRPTHGTLLGALYAAQEALEELNIHQKATLFRKVDAIYVETLEKLYKASSLKSGEFCDFLRVLDLSTHTDELSRMAQEIEISNALVGHGFLETALQRDRLKALVWDLSQPNQETSITRDHVVSRLAGSYYSLFPAPNSITLDTNLIEREQTMRVVEAILSSESRTVCVHGGAGFGKSTLLSLVVKELPEESISVVFDCFAAGAYKNPDDKRHLHKYGLVEIINELAVASATGLLLNANVDQHDLVRLFVQKLKDTTQIVKARHPNAIVCIVIDAADNSISAAMDEREDSFVEDLIRCIVPEGCRLVISCRTHRKDALKLPGQATDVSLEPFSGSESSANLNLYCEGLSSEQIADFHTLTNGNPRVQRTALSIGGDDFEEILDWLRPGGKTVDDLFQKAIDDAALRNGSDELVSSICRVITNLPRPVPIDFVASLAEVEVAAVQDVCSDLAIGLYLTNETVNLKDEDLDNFLNSRYPATDELTHCKSTLFKQRANSSEYASRNLGTALSDANLQGELLDLVKNPVGLGIITDPLERRRIQVSRIRLSLIDSVSEGPSAQVMQLLFALAKESKASEATDRVLDEHPDLALRYGTPATIQRLYFSHVMLGPGEKAWRHMSCAGVFSRIDGSTPAVREHQRLADIELQEWFRRRSERDGDPPEFPFGTDKIDNEYFAILVESYLICEGFEAASKWLSRYRPREFRLSVCRKAARLYLKHLITSGNTLPESIPGKRDVVLSFLEACVDTCQSINPSWVEELDKFVANLKLTSKSKHRKTLRELVIKATEAVAVHGCLNSDWSEILDLYCLPPPSLSIYHVANDDCAAADLFFRIRTLRAVSSGEELDASDVSLIPSELLVKEQENTENLSNKERTRIEKEKDRLKQRLQEHQAVIEYLLPAYQFRAKAICGLLDREKYIEELNTAINASPSSASSYRYSNIRYQWRTHRVKFLCRTILWTSSDVKADLEAILSKLADQPAVLRLDIAELTTLKPCLEKETLKLTNIAFSQIQSTPMSGSERVSLLVRCCEIATEIDHNAGQVYFDNLLKAAEEVDEEVFSIVLLLSELAKRARSDVPGEKLDAEAEKLACVVEDYSYRLDGWDHFPWEAAVSAISTLSPIVGAAVACRWDQAGRVNIDASLPILTRDLFELGELAPEFVLAGYLLPGNWDGDSFDHIFQVLDGVNSTSHDAALKCIAQLVDFCIRGEEFGQRSWRAKSLMKWLSEHGLESIQEVAPLRKYLEFRETITESADTHHGSHVADPTLNEGDDETAKPIVMFQGRFVDPQSIEAPLQGLISALDAQGKRNLYFERPRLLSDMLSLVPVADFIEHLEALLKTSETVLPIDDLLNALAERIEAWRSHPAVQRWATTLPKQIASRVAENIFAGYGLLDYKLKSLLEAIPVEPSTFFSDVLVELPHSEVCERAGAKPLHEFAVGLVPVMARGAALDVLRSLLDDLSKDAVPNLTAERVSAIVPQCKDRTIAAGLVWYLFAHPDTRLRWRTAHACRAMHRLGYSIEQEVVPWLKDDKKHLFCDSAKAFYWLAARQWFFMLVERLSNEDPENIHKIREVVLSEITSSPFPHAVILNSCHRTAFCLLDQFASEFTDDEEEAVKNCLEYTVLNDGETEDGFQTQGNPQTEDNGTRFNFDTMDTLRYWFESLSSVFDHGPDVAKYADEIICRDWEYPRGEDCTRDMFSNHEYTDFSNSHGSCPKIERFHTHLELHAMYCAAVKMLKEHTVKIHHYSDGDFNAWQSWLERWDLSLPPYWIADQRQATPYDPMLWIEPEDKDWYVSPTDDEYTKALGINTADRPEYLLVWGNTRRFHNRCSRDSYIASSLVSPDTAHALLHALQNSNPSDFRLPTEDDTDMEISTDIEAVEFSLEGWVLNDEISMRDVEESDPYAYRSSPTLLRPGIDVSHHLSLRIDQLSGEFRSENDGELIAFREAWCDKPERVYNENHEFLTEGNRLWFRISELINYLREKSRSLIIEVQISRHVDEGKLEEAEDHDNLGGQYDQRSRIYVVDQDGVLSSTRGSHRLRQEVGERA